MSVCTFIWNLRAVSAIGIVLLLCFTFLTGCIDDTQSDDNTQLSIMDMIAKSSSGDTIYLKNCIYYLSKTLFINESISLIGTSPNETIIVFDNFPSMSNEIIKILADDCYIAGVKVTTLNASLKNKIDGIAIYSSDVTIVNCSICNTRNAIVLREDVKNNFIGNNNIKNNSYSGIYMAESRECNISGNTISFNSKYGIYLGNARKNTLWGNVVENCNYGIRLKGTTYSKILKNVLFNNSYGIYMCCGAMRNVVYQNSFQMNRENNSYDSYENYWNIDGIGNYWDDFDDSSEGAYDQNQDGIIDAPYVIPGWGSRDNFPLLQPLTSTTE